MAKQFMSKYMQYSKRIAIFGIVQWSVLSLLTLFFISILNILNMAVCESSAEIINNIITSSSALAVAISGGYYAHSAFDNNLKVKSTNEADKETTSNG